MSKSDLEDALAFQLDALGLTGYVREYQAIKGRKFRFDFCFTEQRLLIEVNGGTFTKGAHSTGKGIARDYEKNNLAQLAGWRCRRLTARRRGSEAAEAVKAGGMMEFVKPVENYEAYITTALEWQSHIRGVALTKAKETGSLICYIGAFVISYRYRIRYMIMIWKTEGYDLVLVVRWIVGCDADNVHMAAVVLSPEG